MQDLRDRLRTVLERAAVELREARMPGESAAAMKSLAAGLDKPCVLAVVGRMKAGKSTFINALLGEDVAKVGATETTATINRFVYGAPDPKWPVRCHYCDGRVVEESREFLDRLQGNDAETLRLSAEIDHLEYRLPIPYLQQTELVDTPGTSAAVDAHQNATADFLDLRRQLRDRHDRETGRWGSEADAVIYLVGPVARAADDDFLREFQEATGGRSAALNAIGVMAKIDLQPEVMKRRSELAKKMAAQLSDSLNTVVPVSAGLRRMIDHLDRMGGWERLEKLKSIPPHRLSKLLDSEEFFRELESDDCPVSPDERCQMLNAMAKDTPWMVFATVVRCLTADPTRGLEAVKAELDEESGFGPLRKTLERHFFERARTLRCRKTAATAYALLSDLRYRGLSEFRRLDHLDRARRERFLAFVGRAAGDPTVAEELREFISLQCGVVGRAARLEHLLKDLDRKLSGVRHELQEDDADFNALQAMETRRDAFDAKEVDELRNLLGLYGADARTRLVAPLGDEGIERHLLHWADQRSRATDPVRSKVAERAEVRYGLLLSELCGAVSKST